MVRKSVKIIHEMRILFLFFIPFCFFLVLGLNPIDVGKIIKVKVGQAVGMSVGVPENKYNKVAAQLEAKEDRLNEREQDIRLLEERIVNSYGGQERLVMFLSAGIVILFILVFVNYYLDYKKKKMSYR